MILTENQRLVLIDAVEDRLKLKISLRENPGTFFHPINIASDINDLNYILTQLQNGKGD